MVSTSLQGSVNVDRFHLEMENLRENLIKMCDICKTIVHVYEHPSDEPLRRQLDKEIRVLASISDNLEEFKVSFEPGEGTVHYDTFYNKFTNGIANRVEEAKEYIASNLKIKSEAEIALLKENMQLKLDLQKEQSESMHQRQSHEYAVAEKNTVLATVRKLEEQLDGKTKQIQQLQREGTVSLWKREKAKVLEGIRSNEVTLAEELKCCKQQLEDTKYRMQQRIQDLHDQVRYLKIERETSATRINRNELRDEIERLKQQLFLKDRSLLVAEGELQRQQRYFAGFVVGLSRDFKIMLERKFINPERYDRDQKAYALMLNKLYESAKLGKFDELRENLPSHYLALNVALIGHPLGKKLKRPFEELEEQYTEYEESDDFNTSDMPSLLFSWRDNLQDQKILPTPPASAHSEKRRESVAVLRKKSIAKGTSDLHPSLVDKINKTPMTQDAIHHFPELSETEVEVMFEQFKKFDSNGDLELDTNELMVAIPDTLGKMATTEEIKEAMEEVDVDNSGTVDFYEFLCVARMISQGEGEATLFKKRSLTALQKNNASKMCIIQ